MLARRLMGSVASGVTNPFTPFGDALYAVRHGTSATLVDIVRVVWDGTTLTFGTPLGRTGMTRAIYGLPCRSSLDRVLILGRDYTTLGTDLQPVGIDPDAVPEAAYGVHLPATLTTSSSVAPGSATYTVKNSSGQTANLTFSYGVDALTDDAVTAGSYVLTTTGLAADPSTMLDVSALYVQLQSLYGYYTTSPSGTGTYSAAQDPFINVGDPTTSVVVTHGQSNAYGQLTSVTIRSASLTLDLGPLVTKASFAQYAWKTTGFGSPYKRSSTYDPTVACAVTDTLGTLLVTAQNPYGLTATGLLVEDASTGKAWTLAASVAARYNVGDAMLYAGADSVTLCNAPAPAYPDAMAQSGTASSGTCIYKPNPALFQDVDLVPWLMALGQPATPVYATGLPGNGQGVLFDAPRGAATVGRLVQSTLPVLIGIRSGTAWFATTIKATGSELCPISQAVPGAAAASQTYQGATVNRVGICQRTRQMTCLVSVTKGVATILPVYGTITTTYLDIGQVVDSSGAPTGAYVSWQSPGQSWARSRVSTAASYTYGTNATPLDIVTVADMDYGVNLATGQVVDLAATAQSPGVAGNVRTFSPPASGSGVSCCCLQHLGALIYVAPSGSYMSTDAGRSWQQVAVSGSPVTAGRALGGAAYSVGTPLFQY